MKTKLIALVDFSPYSYPILALINSWSKIMSADIMLVHQVIIKAPALIDNESRQQFVKLESDDAMNQLKLMATKHIAHHNNLSYHVCDNNLVNELEHLIEAHTNCIVLVGIKGKSFLEQIFIGNTATKIIDLLNTTTVAIPRHLKVFEPVQLVVATNHQNPVNDVAFKILLESLNPNIHSIEFISVMKPGENLEDAVNYLSALGQAYHASYQTAYKIFSGKNVFDQINDYMQQHPKAFLVVQKGSRTLMDQFFRKFLIKELVNDATMPLIIIPL